MNGLVAWISDAFPSKPTFDVHDIPDLSGKVILVTGASTGIGRETARVRVNLVTKFFRPVSFNRWTRFSSPMEPKSISPREAGCSPRKRFASSSKRRGTKPSICTSTSPT